MEEKEVTALRVASKPAIFPDVLERFPATDKAPLTVVEEEFIATPPAEEVMLTADAPVPCVLVIVIVSLVPTFVVSEIQKRHYLLTQEQPVLQQY